VGGKERRDNGKVGEWERGEGEKKRMGKKGRKRKRVIQGERERRREG